MLTENDCATPLQFTQIRLLHFILFSCFILLVYYPPSWVKYCKVICLVKSTQSGEDHSQGCCLEANIFPLDKNLERLAHSLSLSSLYLPNRVKSVAKAAALRLVHLL